MAFFVFVLGGVQVSVLLASRTRMLHEGRAFDGFLRGEGRGSLRAVYDSPQKTPGLSQWPSDV